MSTRNRVFGVCLLLGSVGVSAGVLARPSRCGTIAEARRAPLGTTVTVSGTVTVPTGSFDGGLALQEDDAGVYVLDSLGENFATGTRVTVTGVLVDASGLLAIQPSSVQAGGRGEHVRAARLATGAVGESSEGRLLKLKGTMQGPLVDDSPYGFKLELDDGSGPVQIFLYPGTGIATDGLVDGARVAVTCFSSQFETHYECDPPSAGDLRVHR